MKVFPSMIVLAAVTLVSCSRHQSDNNLPGEIEVVASNTVEFAPRIESLDGSFTHSLDGILLTVEEVQVHKDSVWTTIAEPHQVFDFLQLTDTMTIVLADTLVEAGYYTQLRLIVADTNEVVIDGVSYHLIVPSGTQTGVKLNLDVAIEGGQTARVYLEFDEESAVVETPDVYLLHPAFRLQIEFQP